MSSFIVSQETMRCIVTEITTNRGYGDASELGAAKDQIKRMADVVALEYDIAIQDAIGTLLYAMNAKAVGQRYNEKNLQELYVHEEFRQPKTQVLMSAKCLRYQCSEGDVPDQKLYKYLEFFIEALMLDLVKKAHPEFDDCNWDSWPQKEVVE